MSGNSWPRANGRRDARLWTFGAKACSAKGRRFADDREDLPRVRN